MLVKTKQLISCVPLPPRRALHRRGGHPGPGDGEPDDLRRVPAALRGVRVRRQPARHPHEEDGTRQAGGAR